MEIKVFADVIKVKRSHTGLEWAQPITGVLIKRGNLDTERHTEHHVIMKTEARLMDLQAKEAQGCRQLQETRKS